MRGRPCAVDIVMSRCNPPSPRQAEAAAALMPALKRENTKLKKENVSLRAKLLYRL
jgi:hypothetical protein